MSRTVTAWRDKRRGRVYFSTGRDLPISRADEYAEWLVSAGCTVVTTAATRSCPPDGPCPCATLGMDQLRHPAATGWHNNGHATDTSGVAVL